MMELNPHIIKKFASSLSDYSKFFLAEFLIIFNYINALIIGLIVNHFMGQNFPGQSTPYIIPLIVQTISKSILKYKNRHMERLVQLPSEREDPVFIMKENGDIILSTGLTLEKFKRNNITNISQIIGIEGLEYLTLSFFDDGKGNIQARQIELFSGLFNCWYEIKIKFIFSKFSRSDKEYLIWFTDITELKKQSKRMSNMLTFSNDIITSLPITLERYVSDDIFTMLADFVLSNGYYAVFIAVSTNDTNFKGLIFRNTVNKTVRSDLLPFEISSILASTGNEALISPYISEFGPAGEIERKYIFDEKIRSFLECRINNFIFYKRISNILIIMFNKKENISDNDKIIADILSRDLQTFLNLQDYISSYFMHYLKTLNEEF
jgi:hypothetical protein